ncbi:ATP-binding protein [Deferrisoma camini]|uniref:ATP-binding protein n=1 Tax=Deferrisoma camini TaxID=1035120 RepID=UPI00046C9CA2|nr:ATP-binding protein [Deferrisoma camini]
MFSPGSILLVFVAYMAGLFLLAVLVERGGPWGRRFAHSPHVYALSLAVYCTSWTFYGSVGKAATSGLLFLPIYLGPTLAFGAGWLLLHRMVRLKQRHRITTVADFLAVRYGKSPAVAATVTVAALLGIAPYIALQLKAVLTTFRLLTAEAAAGVEHHVAPLTVIVLCLFSILFGARHLDATERHPGLVAAVSVECLVKLVAFLTAGVFVTFGLFDGLSDLLLQARRSGALEVLAEPSYPSWAAYILLAAAAGWFLPRQFQVAVVEAAEPGHVRRAAWIFPLYMLLINLFVIPIALAGRALGYPAGQADTFVLTLPLAHAGPALSLVVAVGGFSAAAGMIMVSSVALATMATNHLLVPAAGFVPGLGFLREHLLTCRRVAIVGVVLFGYWVQAHLAGSYMLVNIGMISFVAVLQFAVPGVVGLLWRGASRTGALAGLAAGYGVWAYTLLLPALARSGWAPAEAWMAATAGGVWAPEALAGIAFPDVYTHAAFWTLVTNLGGLVLGSLLAPPSPSTLSVVEDFVSDEEPGTPWEDGLEEGPVVSVEAKRERIEILFRKYFGETQARDLAARCLVRAGLVGRESAPLARLAGLVAEAENVLAGGVGAATAHQVVKAARILSGTERQELTRVYSRVLADLGLAPAQLQRRINHYRARAAELRRHAEELIQALAQRDAEIEARTRAERERVRAHQAQQTINRLLRISFEGGPLEGQLARALGIVLESPWMELRPAGAVFLREGDILRRVTAQGLAPEIEERCATVRVGDCLCGLAAQNGRVVCASSAEPDHLPSPHLHGHFIVPIRDGDDTIGVMCLYAREGTPRAEAEETAFLEGLGSALAALIRRARADEALRRARDELEIRVEERTRELRETLAALEHAHAELQQTQAKLVQQAKLASIGQLAAGVAHEINNPLGFVTSNFNTLRGYARDLEAFLEAVRAEAGSGGWAERLEALEQEHEVGYLLSDMADIFTECADGFERIRSIVQNLRSFSRIDALEHAPYDLNEGVRSTLVVARNAYKYVAEAETALGPVPEIDAIGNEINQVLLNLVVNAAQAIASQDRAAPGRITVRTYADDENVYCEVTDDGPGIPPEVVDRLFDPFFTTKPPGEGTGLGLNLSYDIVVNHHGGEIRVESPPQGGARFVVVLPRDRSAAIRRAGGQGC